MDNSTKSFFSGLIFGLTAGAVAGILLAPKSGKETREDIKNLAIEFGEKISDTYMEVKAEVEKRLTKLKAAGKKIDWSMYKGMVNEVLNEFKEDGKVTVEVAERMGTQLGKDWDVLKTSME
jgi:gas vesicle protein